MRLLILIFSFFLMSVQSLGLPLDFLIESQKINSAQIQVGPVVKAKIFQQKLDHFSGDMRTFKQRYWYSEEFAKSRNAPVLMYICGEGACSGGGLMGMVTAHARVLKAYVIGVEHRYYGESQPFADLSTEHLAYLSTAQALEDLVSIKKSFQQSLNLTGPWISVGGSYAGALSAYLRSQYPQEFAASLASSAAVKPLYDFSAYDNYLARIAGPACTAVIQKTLSEIENQIQTDEGFQKIRAQFAVVKNLSRRDDFLYLLSDVTSAALQYDLTKSFCADLEKNGVQAFADMKKHVDEKIEDFSRYSAEAAENISLTPHKGSLGMRQWFYQSCQEYGFWQNASKDSTMRVRSLQINASYHDQLCQRLFQMPGANQVDDITEKYYLPLLSPTTSQIFFTSGTKDPWSPTAISSLNNNISNANHQYLLIENGGHCADLHAGGEPQVMEAKKNFQNWVQNWLKETQ